MEKILVWENGVAVEKPADFVAPYTPPARPAPPLNPRRLRLGLVTNGFALEQVEAAIAAIEDPQQREIASIEWEYAPEFERDHPLIAQIGAALGLTGQQIDDMWRLAQEM